MASQTNNSPAGKNAGQPSKKASSSLTLWGIKNPFIYAGTVVFLVVVIIAFVFFPTSASAGGSGALTFGSYGGKPITYAQGSYMVKQVQALSEANPTTDNSDMANQLRNYQIYRNAFELAIVHEAMLGAVADAGLTVPEELLDQKMAVLPQFQENGAFSSRLYRQMSSAERLDLRRQLKDDYLIQSYASAVYGVRPSSKEKDFIKAMAAETRTMDYVLFPLSSFPDSEVANWAAGKAESFLRLKLSRITASTEAEAAKARKEVEGGASFSTVATAKSKDSWASQGGDMGLRFKHEIEAELANAADISKIAGLAKGALSPVLKTSNGWSFYRLEDLPLAAAFTDPAVLANARALLMQSERGKVEDWVLAKAKTFTALPAADFAANAKKEGLTVKVAGPFSLDYGTLQLNIYGQTTPLFTPLASSTAPELAAASRNDRFLTTAFSLAPGAVSDPLVLGENVLVLRMKEAGAKNDGSMLDFYYPYFFQNVIDEEIRASFLASPQFKDRFMDVYLKYFTPKTGK